MARVNRIGQKQKVKIYELFVPSTEDVQSIEQAMDEICNYKKDVAEQYLTKGEFSGTKMDRKTMGKILACKNSNKMETTGKEGKKTLKCEGQ